MMNGEILAAEILQAIGGGASPEREEAFRKLANAIVRHIQTQMQVTSLGIAPPLGGPVVSTSTAIL